MHIKCTRTAKNVLFRTRSLFMHLGHTLPFVQQITEECLCLYSYNYYNQYNVRLLFDRFVKCYTY